MGFDVRLECNNSGGAVHPRFARVSNFFSMSWIVDSVGVQVPATLFLTILSLVIVSFRGFFHTKLVHYLVSALLVLTKSVAIYRGITASARQALKVVQGMREASRGELEA